MPEIELYVCERDGDWIAPLPEANLSSLSWSLNEIDVTAQFDIDPLSEGAKEIEGVAREIQAWFDGELVWWGTPWGLQGNSRQVDVSCEGLMSLFKKRFVDRTTLLYTSIDQFNIGWNLLLYAQDESVEANRDFNIDSASFSPSGIVRSREFIREEHKNIVDCLNEFDSRTLLNGFDWEIQILPDGGRFWKPYYPRKGAAKAEWKIEWDSEGERNVADFGWSEDYLELATLAYVTGGSVNTGTQSIKMEGKFEDVAASAYWGQMQTVTSEGSQLDAGWLNARAQQEVVANRDPKVVTEITSARTLDMDPFGNVVVGDWIPARIDCGRIQVDAWHRIHEITWNADDTLTYTFGEVVSV